MSEPDRDPFERIYRRHAADVYRFALAVLRDPAEAEDVTQTTFLNAYRAFRRGDRPHRVHSWLIAIAHNTIRSRHRWSRRRPKEVPLDDAVYALAVPDEDQATVREVLEVLGTLPETQRTALALRELEGRSYPEIAETMGVSVPAVESLIARARRTLRAKHQSLRGLTVVQLPRSLRSFFEQGDAGTSLALKAAVVVAAAGALAGGAAVTSKSAGASKQPASPTVLPEPSRALVERAVAEASDAHVATETQAPIRRSGGSSSGRGVPAAAPLPPVGAPSAGGTVTPPGRVSPGGGTTTTVVTTTVGTVTYRPPTAPTLPTLPTLPTAPSSLDPTTWQQPSPPALPTAPQPPTLPTVPQVPAPGGIK